MVKFIFVCLVYMLVYATMSSLYRTLYDSISHQKDHTMVTVMYASASLTMSSVCAMTAYNLGYEYTNCLFLQNLSTGIFGVIYAQSSEIQQALVVLPVNQIVNHHQANASFECHSVELTMIRALNDYQDNTSFERYWLANFENDCKEHFQFSRSKYKFTSF